MYAKMTLLGRLTRDPETRTISTKNGETNVTNFSLACDIGYGQNKRTEFINCTAWGGAGDTIAQYTRKGDPLFVVGVPHTNKYSVEKQGVEFQVSAFSITVEDFTFVGNKSNNSSHDNVPF